MPFPWAVIVWPCGSVMVSRGVMDMSRYLEYPAYASLADPRVFATARAVDGTIGWCDGNIDVAPEVVREEAVAF